MKYWTPEEIEYLKNNVYKLTAKQIAEHLNKTIASVNAKRKSLKLQKSVWSESEKEYLKNNWKNFPASHFADLLNKSISSITGKAHRMGLSAWTTVEIGQRFSKLTVIGFQPDDYYKKGKHAICECDCGKIKTVYVPNLSMGRTKSCGCIALGEQGEATLKSHERDCKKSAAKRGYEWKLTTEEFRSIVLQNCFWCGREPVPHNVYVDSDGKPRSYSESTQRAIDNSWINLNGIDRVINSLDYIFKNCVPCCKKCNISKGVDEAKEYYLRCKRVVENIELKLSSLL